MSSRDVRSARTIATVAAVGGIVDVRNGASGVPRARSEFGADDVGLDWEKALAYVSGRAIARGRWPARDSGAYESSQVSARSERDARVTRLRRLDAKGAQTWSAVVSESPYDDTLALVETGTAVVAAVWCGGATGVSLVSLDAGTGAVLWKTRPYGIGSIGHSKYHNDVSIALEGTDRLRVRGDESQGRYVALVDLATGREISDEVWRR
jgi:outer membrane protein assembly factor BamB